MNYVKITFPEKRGNHFLGFSKFDIDITSNSRLMIKDLNKNEFHIINECKIHSLKILSTWLEISVSGYLYSDKKRAYDAVDCEIILEDIAEIIKLKNKSK